MPKGIGYSRRSKNNVGEGGSHPKRASVVRNPRTQPSQRGQDSFEGLRKRRQSVV